MKFHIISNMGSEIIVRLKCDGTRAETRFHLPLKRTSPFKSAGASVQSTAGSRGVRISSSNARYTTFRDVWEYWLPTPFANFPFTYSPVRHRVPSGFKRNLLLDAFLFSTWLRRELSALRPCHFNLGWRTSDIHWMERRVDPKADLDAVVNTITQITVPFKRSLLTYEHTLAIH